LQGPREERERQGDLQRGFENGLRSKGHETPPTSGARSNGSLSARHTRSSAARDGRVWVTSQDAQRGGTWPRLKRICEIVSRCAHRIPAGWNTQVELGLSPPRKRSSATDHRSRVAERQPLSAESVLEVAVSGHRPSTPLGRARSCPATTPTRVDLYSLGLRSSDG
jgi:hypothetical protein